MHFIDIDSLVNRMNESGRMQVPFIFGVDFEMHNAFFVENPLQQNDIYFQVSGVGNKGSIVLLENKTVSFKPHPISSDEYKNKFDIILDGLKGGYSFLANLTVKTKIETNVSLAEIFARSTSPYQLYIKDKFVCFSPERFVSIKDGYISSNPMKGTIDASVEDAEHKILNDFKETAEHNTIVDLIRNDLSMVAESVCVERFRYIDKVQTSNKEILQVSSEIKGKLPQDYSLHLGDIVMKLLPAGSICGAPKRATIDLIKKAESEPRGFYTGIFGYFDGGNLDSSVLIRYIESSDNRLFYRSGGGITAYSNCDDEYQEVLDKVYLPFI